MLKMVDGTGIIGVDMICPLGVSTPQPPNYDRVELEGTGMLVLPNSLDTPLERLELGGKTEQVQTSGKQLFDASRYEGVTKNGVTVTVKDRLYAPIILLNNCNNTSFTPDALNTRPTATKATTKNPISLENSRLNPK
ncbi:hypothetical protein RUMGNA_03238 [Mediterraneibacter gnavus ATCC 29149]|uniref:Uncharacterized protein n=1 Tax=Mediterraneibacter gnavus (strain ATCC 29149 / DSM 114966 / JCM 6515 / VPI C7-9) TaxID=411470 RepID=A7B6M5_MEDG7|nr:hypothetical protein RUMGNA_03238 [Mediterraneibacter gnavus ATCC 29149]